MTSAIDMSGRRYGALVGLSRAPSRASDKRARWLFRCDCGREVEGIGAEVRSGHKRSCGCSRERLGLFAKGARPPEYDVWKAMRSRCTKPGNKSYRFYGARGITVCERWASFAAFYEDMGPRPSADHQIERRNNDLGYSPDNCVWATRDVQMRNTRRFRRYVIDGVETTIREFADANSIPYQTASSRLRRMGS